MVHTQGDCIRKWSAHTCSGKLLKQGERAHRRIRRRLLFRVRYFRRNLEEKSVAKSGRQGSICVADGGRFECRQPLLVIKGRHLRIMEE